MTRAAPNPGAALRVARQPPKPNASVESVAARLAFLGDTTRPGLGLVAASGFVLTITGTLTLATHDLTSPDVTSAADAGNDQ